MNIPTPGDLGRKAEAARRREAARARQLRLADLAKREGNEALARRLRATA